MSEDKQVMDMVNEHAERVKERNASPEGFATPMCALVRNDSDLRRLLVTVIKALLWVLLGLVVLSMALGGYAGIVAAACVCQHIAQAAVQVDRYFRKR